MAKVEWNDGLSESSEAELCNMAVIFSKMFDFCQRTGCPMRNTYGICGVQVIFVAAEFR